MNNGGTSTAPAPAHEHLEDGNVALKQVLSHLFGASDLEGGSHDILRLAGRSDVDLEDLQERIQGDPLLVALILRRVNSPYYRLDKPAPDLATACRLLGLDEMRNLAMTVLLSRVFREPLEVGTYSTTGLWSHSVAVAAVAQLTSRVCGSAVPTEAFVAGLLHDIGYLLTCRRLPREFSRLVDGLRIARDTPDLERRLYKFDHAELGAYVAAQWSTPESIVDAIRHHHHVERYGGYHRELVYVVAVANYLCSRAGWTALGVHNAALPPNTTYEALELDEVALGIIWRELTPTLERSMYLAEA